MSLRYNLHYTLRDEIYPRSSSATLSDRCGADRGITDRMSSRKVEGERSTPVAFHGPLRGKSRLCRGGSGNAGSCVGRIRHMRALRVARRGIASSSTRLVMALILSHVTWRDIYTYITVGKIYI